MQAGDGRPSYDELAALVVEQRAALVERDATIAAQAETIARLERRVAELERRASRNSGNSSLPPSVDDVPGRKPPQRFRRGGASRRRGKQKGADGSALAWVAVPNETVPHVPQGRCGCGVDLASATDAGVARSHQVHEVPLVTVTVTQHDLHRVRCGCGREHVAARPGEVAAAPSSYGPNLRALVVYLLIFQHVPIERCAQLIADVTGARPSTGFVHGMLARAATALGEVVKLIKTGITLAAVAGFDETTLRAGQAGQKRYVLSASTELFTVYGLGGRDLDSFTDFDVLGRFTGVAVHDRYSLYDHPRFGVAAHQLCLAHLLRDLQDAAETHPDHHWPAQAGRALRGLIRTWHESRGAETSPPRVPAKTADALICEFRRAVRVGLSQIPRAPGANTKQPPGRMLLECLHDREDDVLRFTTDTRIWPTNNLSERDLRPHKTQQKISGRLTCEDATRDRLIIRSYISTARKHGINIMTALRQAVLGDPWIPHTLVNM